MSNGVWSNLVPGMVVVARGKRAPLVRRVRVVEVLASAPPDGKGFVGDDGETYRRFWWDLQLADAWTDRARRAEPVGPPGSIRLIDDLNGSSGQDVRTVRFGYAELDYEIELDEDNDARLRAALEPFMTKARPIPRRGARRH